MQVKAKLITGCGCSQYVEVFDPPPPVWRVAIRPDVSLYRLMDDLEPVKYIERVFERSIHEERLFDTASGRQVRVVIYKEEVR